MLPKTLTAAALAATLALVPADRAAADRKDFIAGAILGGIGGAIINHEVRKKKAREAARNQVVIPRTYATQPRTYAAQPRTYTKRKAPAKKVYRPAIPATTEGRDIQSSLNYFGFDAGTIDGRVGRKTKAAITDYQRYMGYPGTGELTSFQRHVLTTSYLRAEAGGNQTFQDIAAHPDGTRGLLKLYREDLAAGGTRRAAPQVEPTTAYTDL